MSKYIEQSLENKCGHINTFWKAVNGRFDLKNNTGVVHFEGQRDLDAHLNDKTVSDNIVSEIDLTQLPSFESFWTEVCNYILTNQNDLLYNGTLKDTSVSG